MRTLTLIALLALAAGCTSGNSPIYVRSMRPLFPAGTTCAPPMDEKVAIGNLELIDVAATPDFEVLAVLGGMSDYFAAQSQSQIALASGNRLTADGRDRLTVQRVVLRYSSRPAIPGVTASLTDTYPITIPITKETSDVFVPIPLFGKNVRDQLAKLSASNTDPPFQFVSTFEVQGVASSGQEFRTDPISFPMGLVKSEVTCMTADPRIQRYNGSGTASCQFVGINQRIGPSLCCNQVDASGNPTLDFSRSGCDVLP